MVRVFKVMMAILLTLGIQLLAVEPCLKSTSPPESCAKSCCDGHVCPCAKNGEPHQDSTPITPAPLAPKFFTVFKTIHGSELEALASPTVGRADHTPGNQGPHHGYLGVPLSVAFCRFVI
jgi:hypothetical protein